MTAPARAGTDTDEAAHHERARPGLIGFRRARAVPGASR